MNARRLVALVIAVLVPAVAHAGTVLLLRSSAAEPYLETASAFRAAWRGPVRELAADDAGAAARQLAAISPDVVVAVGLKAALLAREALPRTPLVHCLVADPARWQLTGPWVTGVAAEVPPRATLEALKEVAPDARRVGLLYGRDTGAEFARAARAAAAACRMTVEARALPDVGALSPEARALADQADVLWLPADPTVATPEAFTFLLDLSLARRKPLVVFSEALVRAGAMLAVIPDYGWTGTAAATAVKRILAGERAGDVPLAGPLRTRVVTNPEVARALGRSAAAGAQR